MSNLIEQEQFKDVRRRYQNDQWWFAIVDIVEQLTASPKPHQYWRKIKTRENIELSPNCLQLKLKATDGKSYKTECVNIEGAFRIIQSIPSPKAEPIKQWMAKVAKERLEEMANPELAIKRGNERALNHYLRKGHDAKWAKERIEGITKRNFLTDEWKERGVTNQYGKLTDISHQGAFGLKTSDHKIKKGLSKSASLRDNMVDLELSWTNFVENLQLQQLKLENASTPSQVEEVTKSVAATAAKARAEIEVRIKKPLATSERPIKSIN